MLKNNPLKLMHKCLNNDKDLKFSIGNQLRTSQSLFDKFGSCIQIDLGIHTIKHYKFIKGKLPRYIVDKKNTNMESDI